jgi:non-specific serine/threonine protein kinase
VLAEHLKSKKMLLVLDNCEHLIGACAALADALLRTCPELRILATSREALSIAGEATWLVPPLSLPEAEHPPPVEELAHYEAVRLFLERAAAVSSRFELTERNAPAVAQVCRRLDGMPLAIELAAARAKVLSVEQIASRLEDSFRLLATDSRTALPRQQTLRATIGWSYELLSQEEQALFRRLSVFAGGFALEAAEAVCTGVGIEREDVLDLLTHLVDKSLVLVTEQDGEARYRLLETVRQYGQERLEESGEAGTVKGRHAAWFLELAEEAEPELKGRRQVAWLRRLEKEHDNLRAAIRWLLEKDEIETVARFACALWLFWWYHGHQGEGRRYVEAVLERNVALPIDLRAQVVWVRASMSYGLERSDLTLRLWEESVVLFRQTEDRFGLGMALSGMGIAAMQQGDMERATALFVEGLGRLREIGDKWGIGNVLPYLGMISLNKDDYAQATRYFEEALVLARELDNKLTIYISLYNLALASRAQGDHERAEERYAEGLRAAVEAGDKANTAYCLEGLAELAGERGESERAARLFGASEALLEAVGAPRYVHAQDRTLYERAVENLRSWLDEATFGAAWSEGRKMSPEQAIEYALCEKESDPSLPPQEAAGLSARELEVLRLVSQGLTDPQVAERLYLSPRTVGQHLRSIYRKLGVPSRAAAAKAAVERSLI